MCDAARRRAARARAAAAPRARPRQEPESQTEHVAQDVVVQTELLAAPVQRAWHHVGRRIGLEPLRIQLDVQGLVDDQPVGCLALVDAHPPSRHHRTQYRRGHET